MNKVRIIFSVCFIVFHHFGWTRKNKHFKLLLL